MGAHAQSVHGGAVGKVLIYRCRIFARSPQQEVHPEPSSQGVARPQPAACLSHAAKAAGSMGRTHAGSAPALPLSTTNRFSRDRVALGSRRSETIWKRVSMRSRLRSTAT